MNDVCATVMIMTDNGPVRINESDYDPKTHTLAPDQTVASVTADLTAHAAGEAPGAVVQEPAPVVVDESADQDANGKGEPPVVTTEAPTPEQVEEKKAAEQSNTAPMVLLVFKEGKKYFIVDMTGKKVVGDGIEADGYATEDAAMSVITGLTDEQKATVKAA